MHTANRVGVKITEESQGRSAILMAIRFYNDYCSVIASLTPRAANVAANDLCSQKISLGELTTYLRTPFAETPYKINMINVIAMNTMLRINISNIGDEVFGETKSGRKAKKNIDSLGLRILIKNPLVAICRKPFFEEGELNLSASVSRHIDHAR